ncbi:MAG: LysM peptidoglycan-binding domain-containing protein [Treponema sp.]
MLEKGETLYSLSRKYDIPLSVILDYNGITDSRKITIGQSIAIPERYRVEKGDTLYSIAKIKGVSVQELTHVNGITASSLLTIGQLLIIPAPAPEKVAVGTEDKPVTQKAAEQLMQDPRSYVQKPIDKNAVWPVSVLNIAYLSGKLYGVVIDSRKNEPVYTVASGRILSSLAYRGYGQVVFIQSKTKHIYVYGGLSEIATKTNDEVSFGQQIGTLASDPISGKSRLYFMVYENNKPLDPAKAPRGR